MDAAIRDTSGGEIALFSLSCAVMNQIVLALTDRIASCCRCEVRPGPEYVLRKYKFDGTTRFSAHIFYFADADCSSPLYLIRAAGSYRLLLESWTVPGGTEVDYELEDVSTLLYTLCSL